MIKHIVKHMLFHHVHIMFKVKNMIHVINHQNIPLLHVLENAQMTSNMISRKHMDHQHTELVGNKIL